MIVEVNRGCYDTFAAIYDCPVPVIAAVHGFCLGGGIGIAGSSDIVIASEDATFGLPEIDRGALGAATHLMRMFGMQKARRMLYTGESITAAEAYRLGAARVGGAARRSCATRRSRWRAKIAGKSPRARAPRQVVAERHRARSTSKKSYRFEQGFTLELYTSPDSQEARDAFVEKRDAKFDGKKK